LAPQRLPAEAMVVATAFLRQGWSAPGVS